MKKYLMTMAAVACCTLTTVFTACTKVDNPVETQTGRLTVVTSTADLYDQLGITQEVSKVVADGEVIITDSVLLYDSAGRLVGKQGVETTEMKDVTYTFDNLPNGQYTLVVWQTAREPLEWGEWWWVYDEEQLSTVSIQTYFPGLPCEFSVGYNTREFTVDGGNSIIAISPKTMGNIIHAKIDNLTEAWGYEAVLANADSENFSFGYRLDPTLDEADRRVTDDGLFFRTLFELTPRHPEGLFFTLTYDEGMILAVIGEDEDWNREILDFCESKTLEVGGRYEFYYDMNLEGLQPPFLGTPEEFKTWKADRDAGKLVIEPLLKWGCNLEEVDDYLTAIHGFGFYEPPTYDTYYKAWGWTFSYFGKFEEKYYFETEDGKNLVKVHIVCTDPDVPIDVAHKHLLASGYTYRGKVKYEDNPSGNSFDLYVSPDGRSFAIPYYPEEGAGWEIYFASAEADEPYITPAVRRMAPARRMTAAEAFARFRKSSLTYSDVMTVRTDSRHFPLHRMK